MKYLRRKGRWSNGESKFVIEESGKYIGTVPKVEKLLSLLRQDTIKTKPSQKQPITEDKTEEKFVHELLNEPSKTQENRTVNNLKGGS